MFGINLNKIFLFETTERYFKKKFPWFDDNNILFKEVDSVSLLVQALKKTPEKNLIAISDSFFAKTKEGQKSFLLELSRINQSIDFDVIFIGKSARDYNSLGGESYFGSLLSYYDINQFSVLIDPEENQTKNNEKHWIYFYHPDSLLYQQPYEIDKSLINQWIDNSFLNESALFSSQLNNLFSYDLNNIFNEVFILKHIILQDRNSYAVGSHIQKSHINQLNLQARNILTSLADLIYAGDKVTGESAIVTVSKSLSHFLSLLKEYNDSFSSHLLFYNIDFEEIISSNSETLSDLTHDNTPLQAPSGGILQGAWLDQRYVTSGIARQVFSDFGNRLASELTNAMSVIQVLGFIQTKKYYSSSGLELSDSEKLDLKLQKVQLAELSDIAITPLLDGVAYFINGPRKVIASTLRSVSNIITKAFFVFGALFGLAVDSFGLSLAVKAFKKTNDPKQKQAVTFWLITSVFSLVISVAMTLVLVVSVTSALVSTALVSATAVVSAISAGIGTATAALGPIGIVVAILMMVVSGLYTAISTVNNYKEKLNLSVGDQLLLGTRAFFMSLLPICTNYAPPGIENRYQKVLAKEQWLQQALAGTEQEMALNIENGVYSQGLYAVIFSVDDIELKVSGEPQQVCADQGYERYTIKRFLPRNDAYNLDEFNINYLTDGRKFIPSFNRKQPQVPGEIRNFQGDLPTSTLADYLDAIKGLYVLPYYGYRNVHYTNPNGMVSQGASDDVYKYMKEFDIYPTLVGDFNGDNNNDLVRFLDKGVYVALNDGFGSFGSWYDLWNGLSRYRGGFEAQSKQPRAVGDFNGDGYDDIIGFHNNHTEILINRRLKTYPSKEANHIYGFGNLTLLANHQFHFANSNGYYNTDRSKRLVVDLNCDKRADILGVKEDVTIAYSQSNPNDFTASFGEPIKLDLLSDFKGLEANKVLKGDFNNDGCEDVVGIDNEGMVIAFGGDELTVKNYDHSSISGALLNFNRQIILDLNRDSYDDITFVNDHGDIAYFTLKKDKENNIIDELIYEQGDETWFKYPKPKIKLPEYHVDYRYYDIKEHTHSFVGTDKGNGVFIVKSNGEIDRYTLGPNYITDPDGFIAIETGEGNDTIIGYKERANHFYVEKGIKHFTGGDKNDKFILTNKIPPVEPSFLSGGYEEIITDNYREVPIFEQTETLLNYDRDLNQHDYVIANTMDLRPIFNENDEFEGVPAGLEIMLGDEGYVRLKEHPDSPIARLQHIEHATGHSLTADILVGDDGFNALDGLGHYDDKNKELLEGKGGDDLLIMHNGTIGKGGEGDDRYQIKLGSNDFSNIFIIDDDQGQNSIIYGGSFDQISALFSEKIDGYSTTNDFTMIIGGFDAEGRVAKNVNHYLVLRNGAKSIDAISGLTITTNDGLLVVISEEKTDSPDFINKLSVSYNTDSDIKYAENFKNIKGKIKIIRDLFYQKIQVVEMDDKDNVIQLIREINIPREYARLFAAESNHDDETYGSIGDDVLRLGRGNDRGVGRVGADFYVVTVEGHKDKAGIVRINNYDPSDIENIATDLIRIDYKIDSVSLLKNNNDLIIRDKTENYKDIIVEDFFKGVQYQHLQLMDVEEYIFPIDINTQNQAVLGSPFKAGTDTDDGVKDAEGYIKRLAGRPDQRTVLTGMEGDDLLLARSDRFDAPDKSVLDNSNHGDLLLGGLGNDTLIDSIGNDFLKGEEGNDTIVSGFGVDLINPGPGVNFVVFKPNAKGIKYYYTDITEGVNDNNPSQLGDLGRSQIYVPYDLSSAIYSREDDDLRIIFNDESEFLQTEITDKEAAQALENSIIIYFTDFFKDFRFRNFILTSYPKDADLDFTQSLPNQLEGLIDENIITTDDILNSYQVKKAENAKGSASTQPKIEPISIDANIKSSQPEKLKTSFQKQYLFDNKKHLALLVEATNKASNNIVDGHLAYTHQQENLMLLASSTFS